MPCSWWGAEGRCHLLSTDNAQYVGCPLSCGICQPPPIIPSTLCALEAWSFANLTSLHEMVQYSPYSSIAPYTHDGVAHPTVVVDGGSDMFDNGNRIHVREAGVAWTSDPPQLPYTQSCGGQLSATGVGDIQYATCRSPFFFVAVFWSDSGSIGGFKTSGGLGADGNGEIAANLEPLVVNATSTASIATAYSDAAAGSHLYGYYKAVRGASGWSGNVKPSVNHLIASPATGVHTWAEDTNEDHDEVALSGSGASILYYFMWGGDGDGGFYNQSAFQRVLDALAAACPLPPRPPPAPPPPPQAPPLSPPLAPLSPFPLAPSIPVAGVAIAVGVAAVLLWIRRRKLWRGRRVGAGLPDRVAPRQERRPSPGVKGTVATAAAAAHFSEVGVELQDATRDVVSPLNSPRSGGDFLTAYRRDAGTSSLAVPPIGARQARVPLRPVVV